MAKRNKHAGWSLAQRAEYGKAVMQSKADQMKTNYASSLGRAVANYTAVGFNAQMVADYKAGLERGAKNYKVDPERWATNYLRKAGPAVGQVVIPGTAII